MTKRTDAHTWNSHEEAQVYNAIEEYPFSLPLDKLCKEVDCDEATIHTVLGSLIERGKIERVSVYNYQTV